MTRSTKLASGLRYTHRAALVAALTQFSLACGPRDATPVPEPPALQTDRVMIPTSVMAVTNAPITITGGAGAATPGALIEFTPLDSMDLPVATRVEANGSFTISLLPTGEHRAVVIASTRRSKPVDFKFSGSSLLVTERPACLAVTPGLLSSARPGETARFEFKNSCSSTVLLSNLRTRLMLPNFSAGLPPVPNATGSSSEVSVSVGVDVAATDEEVVFVDADVEGQTVRYPLSVYVDE